MKKYDGWFIYNDNIYDKNERLVKNIEKEAEKRDISILSILEKELTFVYNDELCIYYKGEKVENLPNFVYTKSRRLSKQFLTFDIKLISNPLSTEVLKDKIKVHAILIKNNIKTPKTIFFGNKNLTYNEITSYLGNTFVVKDNYGSQGEGVYLITNEEEFNKIDNLDEMIYQEYIKTSFGKDIRALVLDKEVLGAVMRSSGNNEAFRANLSQGGTATEYIIDDEMNSILQKVINIFEHEFMGIDLLFTENGYTVCEINGSPGLKSFNKIKGVRFSEKICDYISKHNKFKK